MHPVGNAVRWIKNIGNFLIVSTLTITMQSLGKIEQRSLALGAKMWCLYVFCLFVTLQSAGALFIRG